MEEFPKREIEQAGDDRDRVQNGEKTGRTRRGLWACETVRQTRDRDRKSHDERGRNPWRKIARGLRAAIAHAARQGEPMLVNTRKAAMSRQWNSTSVTNVRIELSRENPDR
jgi:hypothetical protein